MKLLSNHAFFIKKRLKPLTWISVSILICYIGNDFLSLSYTHMGFIFFQLAAFRYLDEWGCFEYDQDCKKRRLFDKKFKPHLLISSLALFLISLCFGYENSRRSLIFISPIFVTISILFYKFLDKSKFVSIVSLAKYPLLIFLITFRLEKSQLLVTLILFVTYFLYEYKTEIGQSQATGEPK